VNNIVDFEQAKIDKEQPDLAEIINGLTSHNCDTNRPYLEQQPLRAQMEIKGLTRRDISDCMALGILECMDPEKNRELPRVYVSEKGTLFKDWESLQKSGEVYSSHYIDPEQVTYNDLYGWNLDDIDPVAAIQNMACHLERRMGVFPALVDGDLMEIEDNIKSDSEDGE
jgi:hypothetical protein